MADIPTAPGSARRPPELRETTVVSAQYGVAHRLADLWGTRDLLVHLTRTDIRVKYKNSVLGLLWSTIAPLVQLVVFFFVFSVVLKNGIPDYVIYLFAGLIVWNFFQGSTLTSTAIIVERAGIVKKVSFPREILPLSAVGAQIIYFVMQAVAFVIIFVALGQAPQWDLLWLLVISMAALVVVSAAFGILLSAINVKLRDTRHLIEIVMQVWFWATPIVYIYEKSISPKLHDWHIAWLYLANPITPIVLTFQRVLYPHTTVRLTTTPHTLINVVPTWSVGTFALVNLGIIVAGVVAFGVAVAIFGRLEGNFAEEL